MEAHEVTEDELFTAIAETGARALLIGRRAMVAIGLPVLTADYDFWIHIDDAEAFNAGLRALEMVPSHSPAVARKRGRYVIENGEHIDVLVARSVTAVDGDVVRFDDLWTERQALAIGAVTIHVPSLADLIRTKRFSARDKQRRGPRAAAGQDRWRMTTNTDEPLSLRHLDDISEDEFRRRTEAPLTVEEVEETRALVAWFTRRYPTPLARLRYARRKYREWTRPAVMRAP